jgi:hypothetical protein
MTKKSNYDNYPKTGRYRFHGAYKDYHKLWEDFFEGKSSVEPPPFWDYVAQRREQHKPFSRSRKALRRLRLWAG